MESALPMLNCLLQHTLRSLCSCSDSSKWVYAVFWRILPRNYPPPKWDHGGGLIDRAKGNKRNWILVWEDGFCDFSECERGATGFGKPRFGADIFFKMTHEVYNFGEGLVGKVASDNTHKWVFSDSPTELDPSFVSSWNVSIDPQPRAWEAQFCSGIETIAIISVREGVIQLGSFHKIIEDLNMVLSIRRKFSYLQSIPGIYTMQRPYQSIQNPNSFDYSNDLRLMQSKGIIDDKQQMAGLKRQIYEQSDDLPTKSIFLGYNSPQNGSMTIPPLLPSVPWNLGGVCSKNIIPSVLMPCYDHDIALVNNQSSSLKSDDCVAMFGEIPSVEVKDEEGFEEGADPFIAALGFEPCSRGAEKCCES